MNNYPNVGAGLKKMFIAQIGIIVCTVLAIIPIIIFYVACQKYIIEGVVAGAVKG